ncbi:CDP-glycerol glycerophosphotransferase family protein [Pontitalea aquivivens]|uniref:CDP-glycerol glycerophosphotransferase family protein n=1 Tax=Pontitalea aquivivens TaxID=3388663 RepID=UPI0039706CB0
MIDRLKRIPLLRRIVQSSPALMALWRFTKNRDIPDEIAVRFARPQRFSMVVAVYKVEPYLDDFIQSILAQRGGLKNLEVIFVNDGSPDRSGAIIQQWVARRPDLFRYIEQENQGVAAARNAGMKLATGDWISFPDPDDFLKDDYIRTIRATIDGLRRENLIAVAASIVFYYEAEEKYRNSHPLRKRFSKGITWRSTTECDDHFILHTNSTWFRHNTIRKHGIQFPSKVAPTFEDAYFTNSLFVRETDARIVFLPSAIYYYRKRRNQSSLLDQSRNDRRWYLDQLRHGYMELIKTSVEVRGSIPNFIQRICLYEVMWRFRHLLNNASRADFLSPTEVSEFKALLRQILDHISCDTIDTFELAGCTEEHRVGLYAMYKGKARPVQRIYLRQVDPAKSMVQFAYLDAPGVARDIIPLIDGEPVEKLYPSQRAADFLGEVFFREHRFWLRMTPDTAVTFSAEGADIAIIRPHGGPIGDTASYGTLQSVSRPAPVRRGLSADLRRIRNAALSPEVQARFRDAWILMDRADRADDNAEHLYRYMMEIGAVQNAWFALARNSTDWDRLARDGFKLLALDSDEHVTALLNAKFFVSSHADHHLLWPVEKSKVQDIVNYRFVFLQHGVIHNDLSDWLNTKPISLLVTSSDREYAAITDPKGPYLVSKKEVALTGMARHDGLLRHPGARRFIAIMPTWRRSLTVETAGSAKNRSKIDDFTDTAYAQAWGAVLRSDRLHQIVQANDLEIVFCPHPAMAMYLQDFPLADHIRLFDPQKDGSYQYLFANSCALVTDYSSVAFDAAYLNRPVIYFQFDEDSVFDGAHIYKRGYFDYRRDGFGPVLTTVDAAVSAIGDAVSGREAPEYAARRTATFPHHDGKCCQRIYDAILSLDRPD